MGEDVGADLVGGRPPPVAQVAGAAELGQLGRSIEGDPAHQLRRHVVLRLAPRLPDPLIRLRPTRRWRTRPGPATIGHSRRGRRWLRTRVQEDRVEHGAVDVVLALVERAVADPDRTGAGVPAEVIERRLGQVAPPVDAVHDLQRAVVVGLEVGDELHELVGLPVEVQPVQRLQGERRVAHPGVAVVPVALASGRLRQRRRERGHRRAGRHVREALDRQRRALDRLAPPVIGDPRLVEPRPPEHRRGRDQLVRPRRRPRARRARRPTTARSRAARRRAAGGGPARGAPSTPERHVGVQADRDVGARRIGRVVRPVDQRPLAGGRGRSRTPARTPAPSRRDRRGTRPCAPACAGIVVGGRPGVRRDRVGPAASGPMINASRTTHPARRRLPRRLEHVGARLVAARASGR